MTYILDTDVLSALGRPEKNPAAQAWLSKNGDISIYLSVITIGEIRRGVEKRRQIDSLAATALGLWLVQVKKEFRNRILPIDEVISEVWGELTSINPHNLTDAMIAATARVHDMTVVTRNVKDFTARGVRIVNPFELAP